MNTIALSVIAIWIPLVFISFLILRPRRAILLSYLVGWLFLPEFHFDIRGFPDYSKLSSISLSIFLAIIVFDRRRLLSFRPLWFDIPLAVWCLIPIASSLSNDLGAYDAVCDAIDHAIVWGFPYFLGRIYFSDYDGIHDFGIALLIGGLIYVPFCLYEIRMSPILHRNIYGFIPGGEEGWHAVKKFGGWRPLLFMETGLAVGFWMASASMLSFWCWYTDRLRRLFGVPMMILCPILILTTVLCKSIGAIVLMFCGITGLLSSKFLQSRIPLVALVLIVPIYLALRITGVWSGQSLVTLTSETIGAAPALSIHTRITNEAILQDKALRKPLWGWGGYGRARVFDYRAKDLTITDSLWIIALGKYGLVGLISIFSALAIPPLLLFLRTPPANALVFTANALPIAIGTIISLYAIDNLFNAMNNPLFFTALGGLTTFAVSPLTQTTSRLPSSFPTRSAASRHATANS